MNFIDKAIEYVAPINALKRCKARALLEFINTGYGDHGASRSKTSLRGITDTSQSPDEDILGYGSETIRTLRERCRSMHMGNALANGAVKTKVTNTVGTGLKLKPQIDADFLKMSDEEADAWERNTLREFNLWASNKECDAARLCDFDQLQRLAFLATAISGDVVILLPVVPRKNVAYDLRVQLIEADRLCNPPEIPEMGKTRGGVEVGAYGDPIAYHIAKYHPDTFTTEPNSWTRIPAYGAKTGRKNVLLFMEIERPGQRRGLPYLSPVIESFVQLGRYAKAELMAAVVSGMFTAAITTTSGEVNVGEGNSQDNDSVETESGDDRDLRLGNGSILGLLPGEDVKIINPARPNTTYDPFVLAVLREIGSSLEIPLELLTKHFTSTYSAARAALLEATKYFKGQRAWLVKDFCQPIYEEWLAEAVAKGRVSAPGFFADPAIRAAYSGAEWNGPSPGQINPKDEVQAAQMRINGGFSTLARETAEITGGDFEQNHRQRVKEVKMRRDDGLELDNTKIEPPTKQ